MTFMTGFPLKTFTIDIPIVIYNYCHNCPNLHHSFTNLTGTKVSLIAILIYMLKFSTSVYISRCSKFLILYYFVKRQSSTFTIKLKLEKNI